MSKLDVKLHQFNAARPKGYWPDRLDGELQVGLRLSGLRKGKYDAALEEALDYLLDQVKTCGCVTEQAARRAEEQLAPLSADAKSFTLICAAHAHIDMNWMWRFDETVAVTLDTFRTMLDLLGEYPQFVFSQSQASVYRIVEEYGPAGMLEEIRRYIQEGRWEVTASTWVEADKNMPNGESMARHLLYTRRYLSQLLGFPEDSLCLDFEPDTFGHSANVPEILANAGVKYYYHCRGSHDPQLVWWQAPSGGRVLSFRDETFYGAIVDPLFGVQMFDVCRDQGVDTMLKVYGVGDHGGGPSRRDIERIIDMMDWPVYPTLKFGTYREFFTTIERRFGDKLPVRDTEMNAVFTGCYTTQTRIKAANRIGEATLEEAELFGTAAALGANYRYPTARFEEAWQKILFNQFHDILTGSGVMDTREYAMGQFQQTMAAANTERQNALRAIAGQIDTFRFLDKEDLRETRGEGAGVGFGIAGFKVSQVGRNAGDNRVFHVFNSQPYARSGLAEVTVWDVSQQDLPLMEFQDENGVKIPHQLLDSGVEQYWGHTYARALVPVTVPSCGYITCRLTKSQDSVMPLVPLEPDEWQLVEQPHCYTLENECVRAQFDVRTAALTSFIDKKTGTEWIRPGEWCGFRLVDEDVERGMTSWRVGRHMQVRPIDSVHLHPRCYSGAKLRQSFALQANWGRSKLMVTVSLDEGSSTLLFDAKCDWNELGEPGVRMPQLNFVAPAAYPCAAYRYDVPLGVVDRQEQNQDMPGTSFIAALPKQGSRGLVLSTDSKYGYRGYGDAVAVTLIRSSYDPDPAPEYSLHEMKIALGLTDVTDKGALVRTAKELWRPFDVIGMPAHKGAWPLSTSFLRLEGRSAVVQGVKMAEDGAGAIVRLYDVSGQGGEIQLVLAKAPVSAAVVNVHEQPASGSVKVEDKTVTAHLPANGLINLRLRF